MPYRPSCCYLSRCRHYHRASSPDTAALSSRTCSCSLHVPTDLSISFFDTDCCVFPFTRLGLSLEPHRNDVLPSLRCLGTARCIQSRVDYLLIMICLHCRAHRKKHMSSYLKHTECRPPPDPAPLQNGGTATNSLDFICQVDPSFWSSGGWGPAIALLTWYGRRMPLRYGDRAYSPDVGLRMSGQATQHFKAKMDGVRD